MYKISKVCPFCGHVSEILVDDEVLKRMEDGERIQDILPELPASEREVLERIQDILPELLASERKVIISGIRIDCQEEVFSDPDEEDERGLIHTKGVIHGTAEAVPSNSAGRTRLNNFFTFCY